MKEDNYKDRLNRLWEHKEEDGFSELIIKYGNNRARYDLVCGCLTLYILTTADDKMLKYILLMGFSVSDETTKYDWERKK